MVKVDEKGKFTNEAGESLVGKYVLEEGNRAVIEQLKEKGFLVGDKVHKYTHKYPYDWRTKKPVIIRATKQWFANLKELGNEALRSIENVAIYPNVARSKIDSMLTGRDEWCISRQRSWGVPIPVFYFSSSDMPLINSDTISYIANLFEKYGSDCWWKLSEEELLPPKYKDIAKDVKKGMDTMDVWFDSGVSWFSVLQARSIPIPADIYLEGINSI